MERLRLRRLEKDEYEKLLGEAGFKDISIEVTHTYEQEPACNRVLRRHHAGDCGCEEARWRAPSSEVGSRPSRRGCEY